ncbi:MAG: hypothetical protein IJJ63_03050 [Bacilli bacterium]|nr:hypothetical protein [Bacilli bacterium]
MKKLPSIYKNTNTMKDHNNKMCYVNNNKETINDILNNIFSGYHIPYHIKVQITTKSKVFNTYLTARGNNYLLTIQNELIKLSDIIDIKRIS